MLWFFFKIPPLRRHFNLIVSVKGDNFAVMSSSSDKLSAEVVLGFLEDAEPWRLLSPQFPSKVGGKPAWLSFRGLPKLPELECELCHLPMVFLLQVSGNKEKINDLSPYVLHVFGLENSLCVDKVVIRWNRDVGISIPLCLSAIWHQRLPIVLNDCQMPFSCQVYAPIFGQERCFHRTLFLFCCKSPECYKCNDGRCVKGNYCGYSNMLIGCLTFSAVLFPLCLLYLLRRHPFF